MFFPADKIAQKVSGITALALTVASLASCSMLTKIQNIRHEDQHPTTDIAYQHPRSSTVAVTGQQTSEQVSRTQPIAVSNVPELKIEAESAPEAPAPIVETDAYEHQRDQLLSIAQEKLGCRYAYSGTGPNSFDCSGFTSYVFRQMDISLPHSSRDQYSKGTKLEKGEPLKKGDLVFFSGRRGGTSTIGHVGIVVDYNPENDTFHFIHAATSTGVEIMRSTAPYYESRYMGARRIIGE